METIDEDDEPHDAEVQEACDTTEEHKAPAENARQNIDNTTIDDQDNNDLEDDQPLADNNKDETPEEAKPLAKESAQEATVAGEDEANELSNEEPAPIKQVDPCTWWQLHDDWLSHHGWYNTENHPRFG